MNNSRRKFLSTAFTGIAGSAFLFAADRESLFEQHSDSLSELASLDNSESYWDLVKNSFSLDSGLHYFNNGSLGPSPEIVIDATEKFRRTMDGFPSKYMWGGWNAEKEEVRNKAAHLFKVSPEEIALIHSTTEGMNLVAKTIDLEKGDEVILGNHEHTSGTIPWIFWKERFGIKLVRPELPLIPKTPGEIVDVYRKAITSKTKMISICHMVNTNGMILPIREITDMAHKKGILVLVDGAQSAGMLDFSMEDLGCDFYAASSHKWLFSPKGMGIFYANENVQDRIEPLIVSNGYTDTSIRRFENYNSRNLPELLGLGTALDYHALISSQRKQIRIYELKHYFRSHIEENSNFAIKTPFLDSLSAGIQTVELVGRDVKEIANHLDEDYNINVRPMTSHTLNGLRISLSVFNVKSEIDFLVEALNHLSK